MSRWPYNLAFRTYDELASGIAFCLSHVLTVQTDCQSYRTSVLCNIKLYYSTCSYYGVHTALLSTQQGTDPTI